MQRVQAAILADAESASMEELEAAEEILRRNCNHNYIEVEGAEPPYDVCNKCGSVRY